MTTTVSRLPAELSDKLGHRFVVRSYRPEDRPALETMYDAFEPKRVAQGLPPHSPAGVKLWLDRILAEGVHVLVEMDGRIMGHAMLIPMDGGAELANFLHQSVRNRGIGTELNGLLLELARDEGWRRVWLSVEPGNRPAVRSYENVGFRRLPGSIWSPELEMEAILE